MKKSFIVSICLSVIGFIIASYFISKINGQIPIHWNAAGEIDGYGVKYMLFLYPALGLGFSCLMYFLPAIDPKGENIKMSGAIMPVVMIFLSALMLFIVIQTLFAIYNIKFVGIQVMMPLIMGAFFIVLGIFLPKVKSNYTVGIRTPWTIANETVWEKTHKMGGILFIISGALFILGVLMPTPINFIMPISFLIAMIIGLFVYSYIIFKNEENK